MRNDPSHPAFWNIYKLVSHWTYRCDEKNMNENLKNNLCFLWSCLYWIKLLKCLRLCVSCTAGDQLQYQILSSPACLQFDLLISKTSKYIIHFFFLNIMFGHYIFFSSFLNFLKCSYCIGIMLYLTLKHCFLHNVTWYKIVLVHWCPSFKVHTMLVNQKQYKYNVPNWIRHFIMWSVLNLAELIPNTLALLASKVIWKKWTTSSLKKDLN